MFLSLFIFTVFQDAFGLTSGLKPPQRETDVKIYAFIPWISSVESRFINIEPFCDLDIATFKFRLSRL